MATKRMRCAVGVTLALMMVMLPACSDKSKKPYVFMLADFMGAKELPYDSPPQVIYRIDDHRFVSLEKYRDCYHGEAYYNDTRTGVRTSLGRSGVESFQGWLINADPTGKNLAFPWGGPPGLACPTNGCTVPLLYSTDGGKTFDAMSYMPGVHYVFEKSKDYAVFVARDRLYVAKRWGDDDAYVLEYPLVPGIDLNEPYPPGINGGSFALSKRPGVFAKLHTPSGQEHITCDSSIKPTNPDAPLVPQSSATS